MKISIILAALTGSFETDMTRASKTAQKRMKEIEATAKKTGAAIGAALVAGAGAAAVALKSAIDRADELSKTAQKIGITTESLSTLSYAAQLADVDIGALQGGLNRLTKAQGEAAEGNKDLAALFDALGVSYKNADGTLRNADETFRDLARALDRLPDGATKTKAAIDLLGKFGANLIPLTKGLEEAEERARRLGLELSGEAGRNAEAFNDQLSDLKLMVTALSTAVASELLPDLIKLVRGFQDATEEGGGFASSASTIAGAIRGIGEAAAITFNVIKTMTLGIVGLTASVAGFLATYTPIGRLATNDSQRQAIDDLAAVSLAGAGEARDRVLNGAPQGVSPFSGSRKGRGEATRDATLEAIREAEAERAVADSYGASERAAAAAAAAKAGIAAANREAAAAAREAEEAQRRETKAAEELLKRQHEQMEELQRLASEERQEMKRAKEIVDQTLADIAFETKLIGLNNLEREKAIALRYANVEAASAEGQAISAALDELDKTQRIAEGMDVVRESTRGLFQDLMDGSKSAKDAFKDFVANILDGIAQIVAQNLTEQLLGSFGSTGGGASGGWLSGLFGAFFGGARASGGPVYPGRAYLVGEEGPELVVPSASGTVIPADRTAAMRGGGRGATNITFVLPGRNDLRTEAQRQSDLARSTNRQLARGTA